MKSLYTVVEVTFNTGLIVQRTEYDTTPFETESMQEALDRAAELNKRKTPSQTYLACQLVPL